MAVPRREAILELLRGSPRPLGISELAARLDVHPNTVRYHLEALIDRGRAELVRADPAGPGRPPALFRATRRMDPAGPRNYRLLAMMLTGLLATDPGARGKATELGRAWGPRLVGSRPGVPRHTGASKRREALADLRGMLTELGFAPEPPLGNRDRSIQLRHCPFLEAVTTGDDEVGAGPGALVCSLHLGLMQGALTALEGPVTVDRLEPFVQPDLCVAHLAPPRPATAKDHGHA